jgi:hypothetical protein
MRPQEIYLQLIESAGQWNAFDGPEIARSLKAKKELWHAVIICDCGYHRIFDREGNMTGIQTEYAVLRGLPEETLFFDTIRITPQAGRETQLEDLAGTWDPDTIKWLPFDEASSAHNQRTTEAFSVAGFDATRALLELWWD